MSITKTITLLLFASCLLFLSSCKKDPKPSPCEGKNLPKADFILAEKLEGEERYFETDKINHVRTLFLRGPDGYDEYLWQLGSNLNWSTKKNAVASFSKPEGLLKVRLIAKRKPFTDCFPNDDGIDTIEKTIEVVQGSTSTTWVTPILGYWEGTSTQFNDTTYIIRFYAIDSSGRNQQNGSLDFYLYNLTRAGCSSTDSDFPNYMFWTGTTAHTQCKDTYTYLAYTTPANTDSIIIEYTVQNPPENIRRSYVFTGKRK